MLPRPGRLRPRVSGAVPGQPSLAVLTVAPDAVDPDHVRATGNT